MATGNGSVGWVKLGLYIAATIAALAIAYGEIGHAVGDNTEFRVGDGAENTKYRITGELNQKYMDRRFDRIEAVQRQILEEVRK